MARRAPLRGWLVILLRGVALDRAARAVVARRLFVRAVAARALGVAGVGVQAGALRRRVTARACRWLGRTVRSVRAMAIRAVLLAVAELRCGVAARARGARLARARVSVVAVAARGVAARRRRRFGRVARRACGALRARIVGRVRVARRAVGVTARDRLLVAARTCRRLGARCVRRLRVTARTRGVARRGGGARLVGVTARAQIRVELRSGRVRLVAIAARGLRVRRLIRVARRAGDGLRGAGERVRWMAGRARVRRAGQQLGLGRVRRALRVTLGARLRCRSVVLRMTARATAVLGRSEHRLRLVTRAARLHLRLAERVRCVTGGALRVAAGGRARVDVLRTGEPCVTARATGVGGGLGLVHAVAITTPTRAGMGGALSFVARLAR